MLFSLLLATATSAATTNTWIGNTGPEWGTNGNWTTTNVSGIPATGDTLVFDSTGNSGVPSDDNLGNAFSIATLNFVNNAGSYTLTSNSGVNDQSLSLSTSLIVQSSGATQTINMPIVGTGTLFMGSTTVATPDTNGNATLVLNANAQFTALSSSINNGSADTLQIGNSNTLTLNGSITVGGYNISAGTGKLIVNGGSLIDTPGGTAVFAVGDSPGTSQAVGTTTVLDLSGLNTFRFTGQQVDVGGNQGANTGNRAIATLTLAGGTNTIVASSATNGITVGGGSTSNGGTSILHLNGTAVNTLDTAILQIGTLKSTGTVDFSAGSGGTFVFRNAAGTGRAPIFVGLHNGAGTAAAKGTLNLLGHSVDILAITLTVGSITGSATGNATLVSTASFDTGTVDTTSILLGNRVATALGTPQATFNMGGGNLIVNSSTGPGGGTFVLGNNASTATGNTTGTFNLSGGTATINTNITMGAAGSGTTGVINLTGGTLSMGNGTTNFAIGASGTGGAITTFNMPTSGQTATIQNLGGTGIFASGGSGRAAAD